MGRFSWLLSGLIVLLTVAVAAPPVFAQCAGMPTPAPVSPQPNEQHVALNATLQFSLNVFVMLLCDHDTTQWQVADSEDFENADLLYDTGFIDTDLKKHIVPNGVLAPKTNYYWRARVRDVGGFLLPDRTSNWSEPVLFKTRTNDPCLQFEPFPHAPENDEIVSTPVEFQVVVPIQCDAAIVRIRAAHSEDALFDGPLSISDPIGEREVVEILVNRPDWAPGDTIYWQAQLWRDNEQGPWSDVRRFGVSALNDCLAEQPQLLSPLHDEEIVDPAPVEVGLPLLAPHCNDVALHMVFNDDPNDLPNGIQLTTDPVGGDDVYRINMTLPEFAPGTTVYWQARLFVDFDQHGPWTETRRFVLVEPQALPPCLDEVPVIVSPTQDQTVDTPVRFEFAAPDNVDCHDDIRVVMYLATDEEFEQDFTTWGTDPLGADGRVDTALQFPMMVPGATIFVAAKFEYDNGDQRERGPKSQTVEFQIADEAQPPEPQPPNGDLTVAQAIAQLHNNVPPGPDADNVIGDSEILKAIELWILGQDVPGTQALTVSDAEILRLISSWISAQPV